MYALLNIALTVLLVLGLGVYVIGGLAAVFVYAALNR